MIPLCFLDEPQCEFCVLSGSLEGRCTDEALSEKGFWACNPLLAVICAVGAAPANLVYQNTFSIFKISHRSPSSLFIIHSPQSITMNLSFALVASLFAGANALQSISEVKADSKFGMDLLSKARRVEDNGNNGQNDEADATWVAGYALKFQGCHHIAQWNANAEENDEDVRIETKRLARFRLCPVNSCSDTNGAGCNSGYGDYIVDMDTFLESFLENKQEAQQQNCEYYAQNNCDCYYADDQEQCQQTCFYNAGMSECIEQEEQEGAVNLEDYAQCAQYGGRRLEDNNNGGNNGEYYIGPYCSDYGGKIVLGMFTDDTCTEFADEYGGKSTFESMTGSSLPYSSDSIVDTNCYSCEKVEENDGGDDQYRQKEASETCEAMYSSAGKCETSISYYDNANPNEDACTYMQGIKITRSNGIIIAGRANSNKVASAFIGIFSISFVALGSYVYYLKTKLDRGSLNLSD
jgi:hypothetical protein